MSKGGALPITSAIEQWGRDLVLQINEMSSSGGRKVVVIALSRKMPRLLESMSEGSESFKEVYTRLLESCIYTTEHAIPFVVKKGEPVSVLILDDVVFTGRTIQHVIDEVNDITSSQPHVFALYKNSQVDIRNAQLHVGETLRADQAQDMSRIISNLILHNNLPVDLEYPILKIKSTDAVSLYDIVTGNDSVPVMGYDVLGNKAVILEDEMRNSYNNDFAKLRFFTVGNAERVVPFAPNIFSESNLINDRLFYDDSYRALYHDVLNKVSVDEKYWMKWDDWSSDKAENRRLTRVFRTLSVWANYLFSLSSFIRYKNKFNFPSAFHFEVEYEDVRLILGDDLAKAVVPKLNQLIAESKVSPSLREMLNVPACIVNRRLMGAYLIHRNRAVLSSVSVVDALTKVFHILKALRASTAGYYMENEDFIEPRESYESLLEALSIKYNRKDIVSEVYRWVDEQIDNGIIIPRYERVVDNRGFHYWRRFFKMSPMS